MDLAQLVGMLEAEIPPLSPEDTAILDKVKAALEKRTMDPSKDIKKLPEPFVPIEQPGELPPAKPKTTRREWGSPMDSQKVFVGQGGAYRTIAQALRDVTDGTTIIVTDGVYTDEDVEVIRSVHVISEGDVILHNCHFHVNAKDFTMKDFQFEADGGIFEIKGDLFGLSNCRIRQTVAAQNTPPFILKGGRTEVELNECEVKADSVFRMESGGIVNIFKSEIYGTVSGHKAKITMHETRVDGKSGIGLEASESNIVLDGCMFTGSSRAALLVQSQTEVRAHATEFKKVNGSGIVIHGLCEMDGSNLRFDACKDTGIIVADVSNVRLEQSSITNSGRTGCEVMSGANLKLENCWIADTGAPGILCDERANVELVNCCVTKSMSHGIEANNNSTIQINNTLISECEKYGVLINKSCSLNADASQFSGCKDVNCCAFDRSQMKFASCNFKESGSDGLSAAGESAITCQGCYFIENKRYGMMALGCRDVKIDSSSVYKNKCGGTIFKGTKQVTIDHCRVEENDLIVEEADNAIVKDSYIYKAHSKMADQTRTGIEFLFTKKGAFEENFVAGTWIHVKSSELSLRHNTIKTLINRPVVAPLFAIIGEFESNLYIESNEISMCRCAVFVKDNSQLYLFNNKITELKRLNLDPNRKKDTGGDMKTRAIFVRTFSKGTIEGNVVSGDYDYAIYVDGQSDVECRANNIAVGGFGGIWYTGMSSGLVEGNSYTGENLDKAETFLSSCTRKRKQA